MVNNPNIRFTGFSDEWEERKLGDITQIKTGSSDLQDAVANGEYPFFVRSNIIEKSNRYIFDGEAILIPGEGRIGEIYHYINGKFDFHQRVYKISGFSESDTYGKYVLYYMQKMFKQHAMKFTVKATVDSLRLPVLSKFDITLPTLKEQQKIGSVFSTLDHKIGLEERQIELLKNLKKGLLQKMFPKNGATVPELRFAGFADDWEERKLSEIGKIVTGNTPNTSNKDYYNGDFLFVSPADIQENRYVNKTTTTLTELGFKTGRLVPKGATLFVSIGSTIGKTGQSICDVITNQQINSVISFSDYDDDFIYTSILNSSTKIKQLAATQAVPIINKNEFGKSIIKIPSLEEQQKIGAFFKQLDDTITLHQRKLELLKDLKKGLSQQMFV